MVREWARAARFSSVVSTKPAAEFREWPIAQIAENVFEESRMYESAPVRDSYPAPSVPGPAGSATGATPRPATGGRLAGDVVARRISVRRYTNEPLSAEQLSTMLHCASQGDRADWCKEHEQQGKLQFQVLASRIDGISPGVYTYDHDAHSLRPRAALPDSKAMSELFIQPEFTGALGDLDVWRFAICMCTMRRVRSSAIAVARRSGRAPTIISGPGYGIGRMPDRRHGSRCCAPAVWV